MFHDVSAAHYLERFLKDANPHIRSNAIIALWQFPHYRLRLTILLTTLIEADDRITQKAAIHTLGEIGALQEKPRLLRYLEHTDPELQLLAALALAKLDHEEAPAYIAEFVLHENKELAELARKHLCHTPHEIQKSVQELVHQKLSARLTDLLATAGVESLLELSPAVLGEMRELYTAAGDWEEVAKVDAAAAGRELD
jgi:HEAT repeat protein